MLKGLNAHNFLVLKGFGSVCVEGASIIYIVLHTFNTMTDSSIRVNREVLQTVTRTQGHLMLSDGVKKSQGETIQIACEYYLEHHKGGD